MSFKIGDKVRCVSRFEHPGQRIHRLTIGDIYTVTWVGPGGGAVRVINDIGIKSVYRAHRFEPIEVTENVTSNSPQSEST